MDYRDEICLDYDDDELAMEILQTCDSAGKTPALTVDEVYCSPTPDENDDNAQDYGSVYNYDDDRYKDNASGDGSSSDAESIRSDEKEFEVDNENAGEIKSSNDEILTQLKATNKLLANLEKGCKKQKAVLKEKRKCSNRNQKTQSAAKHH